MVTDKVPSPKVRLEQEEKAKQQRIETLAKVAGSETYANRLFEAITDYNQARAAAATMSRPGS